MKDRFQKFREIRALPSTALRIYFFAFVMLGGLGVLAAKLWHEQMVRSEKWRSRIRTSGKVTVRIPSVRGDILDRNGWVLAENQASYGVDFYFPQMVEALKDRNRGVKGWKLPVRKMEVTRDEMRKVVEVPDIVAIINEEIRPRLNVLGLSEDDPAVDLNYNAEHLETHYRAREHVPFTFLENVKFETVAKICENDLGLPGVEVGVRPVRRYLYDALACHMLGYVGRPEDENKERDYYLPNGQKRFDFYKADIVGRASIEKYCDIWLRGQPGMRVLERSAKGKIGAEIERIQPIPGNNVYLTIDARIQMIAEQSLREAGVGRAAAVVVDPNNGDILAMASVPNYDPNTFAEQLKAMDEDKTDPLLHRAIESYPPGSTYKQVTALAILRAGISPGKTWNCTGGYKYGGRFMKCTGSHGPLDLSGAIKKSCNSYFYQITNGIGDSSKDGFTQLEVVGQALGLGMTSGLPISGEDPGVLPGPKYYASKGLMSEMESSGQLANAAIGQGKVVASPLQMAMVTATVANGGRSYYPRLISRVVDNERNDVRDENNQLVVPVEPKLRANLLELGLKESDIEVIRRGMWKVVNEAGGTGKRAKIKGVEVAGKTGTAQAYRMEEVKDENGRVKSEKKSDYRVWFCSFAPYKDPKYAICVMVETGGEEGSGGKVAAPIATKILKESLALIALDKKDEADAKFRPHPISAVAGSFNPVSAVELKDDGSLSKIVAAGFTDQAPGAPRADDDDRVDRDENAPVVRRKRTEANVAAKKAADARGTLKPSEKPARQPTLFERIFGKKSSSPPTGTPSRPR
jgi:penicillin-binding protein 2